MSLPAYAAMKARDFADDVELVYSAIQIAEFRPGATGRRMTVREAKERFGEEVIDEIIDKGAAIIHGHPNHPDAG